MKEHATTIIPEQRQGSKSDTGEQVELPDLAKARQVFNIAKKRLVHVNEWHRICPGISAVFALTDKEGQLLDREAKPGDYICINIPGPGSTIGKGNDWVHIERIEDHSAPYDIKESFGMQVRPSSNPGKSLHSVIAHFFTRNATSNFIIERNSIVVKAEVHGRNEKLNIHTERLLDNIRNAIAGTLAIAGFSRLQWNELAKGLVNTETKASV